MSTMMRRRSIGQNINVASALFSKGQERLESAQNTTHSVLLGRKLFQLLLVTISEVNKAYPRTVIL